MSENSLETQFTPETCIIKQWIDEGLIKDRYKCYLTDEQCFCESIGCYWLEGTIEPPQLRIHGGKVEDLDPKLQAILSDNLRSKEKEP